MSSKNNFFKRLSFFKKKIALISEFNKKISYASLLKKAKQFSYNLREEKSLVFLIGKNNLETIIAYVSFINKGYAVFFVDFRINEIFLQKLINKYKPAYIFCENRDSLKSYNLFFKQNHYSLFDRKNKIKINLNKELMLLMQTSGSTGSSKLVRLSYENVESNTSSIIKYLKIRKKDITITTLPISYVYGLSIVNTHLKSGATIVLTNKSVVENLFWDLFKKYKITSFGGVPFQYDIIVKIFKRGVPRSLKYSTQAGGKMNEKLIKNLIKIYSDSKKKFIQMYGAAEATSRMSYLKWEDAPKKIGSIGKSIPGGKFFLRGKNGEIKKSFVNGELIFKGKNVSLGYAKKISDLSLSNKNNKILNTGDLAFRDEEGFYYIVGRKNRYTKIYGSRVSLSDLENILSKKGIEVVMKATEENQILSFFKNKKDIKRGIKYLSKLTLINPKVFISKIISKKNLTYNLKYKI